MNDSNYLKRDFVGNLYDVSYPVINCHGSTIGSDCADGLVITHGQIHFTIQFSDPCCCDPMLFCQKSKNQTFVVFFVLILLLELKPNPTPQSVMFVTFCM